LSMRLIPDLSSLADKFRLAILLMLILLFHGCAVMRIAPVEPLPPPPPVYPDSYLERNNYPVMKEDDVIGRLAYMRVEKEDTLPDIARHFSLGINAVNEANPGIDTWLPEAGKRILLPLSFILPDTVRKGIVINLAAMRLFHFKEEDKLPMVSTYPVGVGTVERPSPLGQMYIERKMAKPTWYVPASIAADHRKKGDILPAKVPPGPLNPLGEYALYLNKGNYLIHGTNKPASIGLRATNGCIRLYPEDIKRLFEDTPVKTPVIIVNQPYLIGRRDGTVYMEVHKPFEESGGIELEKAYTKLKNIEKRAGRTFDWNRIKEIIADARGIPVPIMEFHQETRTIKADEEPIELRHPDKLYGKPEVPDMKTGAWYVLAAATHDKADALRLAAIINHQGPHIPARVLSNNKTNRVITGPFSNMTDAKDAIKQLKFDLEIDGILIEPFK